MLFRKKRRIQFTDKKHPRQGIISSIMGAVAIIALLMLFIFSGRAKGHAEQPCMVVCCGVKPSEPIIRRATERGCTVITTPLDTYGAAKLVGMAVPVRYRMVTENIQSFHLDTNIEDVRKVMAGVRHRYFPVLDQNGKYCGVIFSK